jgi:hypothetical protein
MKKDINSVVAVITIIGAIFGAYFFFTTTFAKCADLKRVEYRMEYKIQSDYVRDSRRTLWDFQDKYGVNGERAPDPIVKDQMQKMKNDLHEQEQTLDNLKKQQMEIK